MGGAGSGAFEDQDAVIPRFGRHLQCRHAFLGAAIVTGAVSSNFSSGARHSGLWSMPSGAGFGELREVESGVRDFGYIDGYEGPGVSLTMPVRKEPYVFRDFRHFWKGCCQRAQIRRRFFKSIRSIGVIVLVN